MSMEPAGASGGEELAPSYASCSEQLPIFHTCGFSLTTLTTDSYSVKDNQSLNSRLVSGHLAFTSMSPGGRDHDSFSPGVASARLSDQICCLPGPCVAFPGSQDLL